MNDRSTSKKLSLKQNMLWSSAGSMINMVCQWLITVLIIRLSFGNYDIAGVYTLAMSVYAIFSHVAHYRMYVYQVTDVENENTIGEYLAFRVITCFVALIACGIYGVITCELDAILPILLYGVFKSAGYMIDVFHAEDQRYERMDYIGISLGMQGISTLVLFSVIFYFTQNLSLALLAMAVGVFLIGMIYDYPRTNRFKKIKFGITCKKTTYLFKHCFSIVAGFMAGSCAPSIPRQFLFYRFGDSALGVYGTVSAPVAVIQMGASYIYNPLMGYFADHHAKKNREAFKNLFAKASLGILGVGVVCTILLIFFCEPLLVFLFGSSIESYVDIMPLIAISSVLFAYMAFLNDLMITCRKFGGALIGGLLALAVSGITTPFLVNSFYMNGVTLAMIIGAGLSSLFMLAYLFRSLKRGVEADSLKKDE